MAYKSTLHIAIDSSGAENQLKRLENRLELTDKAGKKTSGSIGSLTTTMKAAGGAMVGLSAGVGVFSLIARNASQSAAEIDNLSRLANTNSEEFQRAAFASRAYGVEQDKLADILKDTNDRVGDFLSTGGGEMKDFFEQIAPQIGVTAEEFRNLSGPQALQKYYDGLQAANLSQAEMTFYMESVADEATALIPLLRDGGAEMQRLGQEADDLGAVLSQMEIQRLKDIRGEFGQLEQQLGTETMRAVSQFDDLFKSSLEGISYGINNVARGFNVFMDSFRDGEAKRSIAGIDAELNALFDTKARLEQRIDMFGADAPQAQDSIAALGELREEYTALIDRKKELQQAGLPVTEPEIVQLSRAVISTADLAKAQKDAQAEADRFSDSLLSIQDRLFPLEASQRSYREDQEMLAEALDKGEISVARYMDALDRLQQQSLSGQNWQDAYGLDGSGTKELEKMSDAARDLGLTFESAFEDAVLGGENFRSVLGGIAEDIARITLRKTVTEPFGNAITGVLDGIIGGSGISGPGAYNASAGDFLGSVGFGKFASGGYTGDGNKYDPAGIVHAGEFVVQKSVVDKPGVRPALENLNRGYASGGYVGGGASGAMGGDVSVHIHNEGRQMEVQRTEQRQGPNGERQAHIWLRENVKSLIMNGELDRTMANVYGVKRGLTGR
tara:strand:+ start:8875 stop:10887 length:2013 start_codon:yes stop_codon:yes gene_type:complete